MRSQDSYLKRKRIIFERINLFLCSTSSSLFRKILGKEKRTKKSELPYLFFAFLAIFGAHFVVLIVDYGNFQEHMESFFNELYILIIISPFMSMMLAIFLKKMTITLFYNENIQFPKKFNKIKKSYIEYIFFNVKSDQIPKSLKRWNIFYLVCIFTLCPIGGVAVAGGSILEGRFHFIDPIVQFFWVPFIWFVTMTLGYYMIGIMYLLHRLMKDVEEDKLMSKEMTVASLQRYENLRKMPILLLFCYSGFLIAFPNFIVEGLYDPIWRYYAYISIFFGVIGFIITLIVPNYFVYKILNENKKIIKKKIINDIEKTEKKINEESYQEGILEKYNAQQLMMSNLNKIKSLPSDSRSVFNVFTAFMISNVYYLIQVFKWAMR